jgi:hypothetical protein
LALIAKKSVTNPLSSADKPFVPKEMMTAWTWNVTPAGRSVAGTPALTVGTRVNI